jgi:hypothetical protein
MLGPRGTRATATHVVRDGNHGILILQNHRTSTSAADDISEVTSAAAQGDIERIRLIRSVVIDQPRLRVEGSGLRGSETEFNI